MNMLEAAIEAASALEELLAGEIEAAAGARAAIRSLQPEALLARAARREALHARAALLSGRIAADLARAAHELGIPEVTLDHLQTSAPAEGARLGAQLARVRVRAAELQRLDRLEQRLAGAALGLLKSHLHALAPPPSAYDRRGGGGDRSFASTRSGRV